jgi:hypothetical protein
MGIPTLQYIVVESELWASSFVHLEYMYGHRINLLTVGRTLCYWFLAFIVCLALNEWALQDFITTSNVSQDSSHPQRRQSLP